LADAYVVTADYGMIPAAEAYESARENATMALKVDPSLSQPHAALAAVHERSFNWAQAEIEYAQAIALNPNNVTARHWYALDLFFQGKEEAAISEWRKAMELDPLSLIVGASFGYALVRTGRKEEGLAILRAVIDLNDAFVVGHRNLAWAYLSVGMEAEAVEEAKKLVSIDQSGENMVVMAIMYAEADFTQESTVILDRLLNERETRYIDPFGIAQLYGSLGDEVNALNWLEKAVKERSAGVAYIKAFPPLDQLRNNPKFTGLLKQVGLT
jgi:tetratricopeptide (TPR) repeat protein